jgi:hypothetical protein
MSTITLMHTVPNTSKSAIATSAVITTHLNSLNIRNSTFKKAIANIFKAAVSVSSLQLFISNPNLFTAAVIINNAKIVNSTVFKNALNEILVQCKHPAYVFKLIRSHLSAKANVHVVAVDFDSITQSVLVCKYCVTAANVKIVKQLAISKNNFGLLFAQAA